ncbi:M20/M25/M40 family metallo-hydrolase [Oenococcus oeni]|uniref:M20/M25/M40 family metallo-hydrolase n=1 Tax=Oenococcus oeni TaxID=1247 RepID=UPI00050E9378|nr:M20/M25/M40 family metallo-hydrolase [Oenococcus oeni]KGH99032.1 acetylornithine deacetylase [Oenococcus oeni IOEB_1491]KGI05149.1 acetylornithine deacetylase [Oenococcus oeni S19]OIL71298.1 acetylornithine deacetylase [Oenococcus oeni]OIM03312.1 acetylornithine deacetylase [Oenococcus oeni]
MQKTDVGKFAINNLSFMLEYLKIPSVSAKNMGITEIVDWLTKTFKKLGADKVSKWRDQGGNPVVFAEFKGKMDKTILFYNHYDVQPVEPLNEWSTDPFKPEIKNGKIFARGVCDDKGELISRLTLIKYFNENGGLPLNLKFFVEGEEELGSPHVDKYVHAHSQELKSDACIWEGGGKDENDNFKITCGLKGIASFDLKVKTAGTDLHSSLASYADNAAWRLVESLNSLHGNNGEILVDGFYDDIEPLDDVTRKAIEKIQFNSKQVKAEFGLLRPFITKNPVFDLINGPTMTINGLSSGYEGKGLKTIVPKEALAKMDCRLLPNQDPKKIANLIQAQLIKNGFDDVRLSYNTGEEAFRTDLSNPFVQQNIESAKEIYGEDKISVVPNMPGGGPARQFVEDLKVPIVMVGINYAGSGPHAPNENIRLDDYSKGSEFLANLLVNYSKK